MGVVVRVRVGRMSEGSTSVRRMRVRVVLSICTCWGVVCADDEETRGT